MSTFSLKDWAEEYELTEETLGHLQDKGFGKLTGDMVRKDYNKLLKPAQVLLFIQEAVESLHEEPIRPDVPEAMRIPFTLIHVANLKRTATRVRGHSFTS